mgnify:CR=1 FL=1
MKIAKRIWAIVILSLNIVFFAMEYRWKNSVLKFLVLKKKKTSNF